MASFNIHSVHALDDEQLNTLVSIVLDDYGPTLARVRFNDVILSLSLTLITFRKNAASVT